tara:strand:+ start:62 stop:673 length:612 start_codon:yes stop_codon:yes gene_type:complete
MVIRVTDRDVEIIKWLNKHGYATVTQIAKYISTSKQFAYARLKKLVDNQYIEHQRIFAKGDGIYKPSLVGNKMANEVMKPVNKINLQTYQHNLKLVDLSMHLLKSYSCEFITERQLRHEKGNSGIGRLGHISDGILLIDGKKIAIELELTGKSNYRLEKIINEYVTKFEFEEVWYFCSDEVKEKLTDKTAKYGFFKVHSLINE